MRTLYIECNMGAAGDMLMSALYELLEEEQKEDFITTMNHLGLPGVKIMPRRCSSCGISGTHMEVTVHGMEEHEAQIHEAQTHGTQVHEAHPHHDHDQTDSGHGAHYHKEHGHGAHHHAEPGYISDLIGRLPLPAEVRERAAEVYRAIAAAEAKAHGCPVEEVHFHEVGALDAVADVAGVCYAVYLLHPDRITASPVHVGSGTVRCAHGIMPVPAPATAHLLEDVPVYGGSIRGELCTPTGAALLVSLAKEFGDMPMMTKRSVGVGIGTKQFEQANCVRAFLGEEAERKTVGNGSIAELVCNIDDMTPEALSFALQRILENGALDAYCKACTMKKGRPGWELTVLCAAEDADKTAQDVLRETTTNGVRARVCEKYFLNPGSETVETRWGSARIKTAEGFGIRHVKPEYEDSAQIARKAGLPYREACEEILSARKSIRIQREMENG